MNQQKFGVRIWLWIALGIAILIGGGFIYWYILKNKDGTTITITPTKSVISSPVATWTTYENTRVNYSFEYPAAELTMNLDETIKYPSTKEGDSKTEDLVQFATDKITYSIKTEIDSKHQTIEDWIQDADVSHANTDLTKYTEIKIDNKTAYTYTGELRTYTLNNGNVYIIKGMDGVAPSKNTEDSIYKHLLDSFKFK